MQNVCKTMKPKIFPQMKNRQRKSYEKKLSLRYESTIIQFQQYYDMEKHMHTQTYIQTQIFLSETIEQ